MPIWPMMGKSHVSKGIGVQTIQNGYLSFSKSIWPGLCVTGIIVSVFMIGMAFSTVITHLYAENVQMIFLVLTISFKKIVV